MTVTAEHTHHWQADSSAAFDRWRDATSDDLVWAAAVTARSGLPLMGKIKIPIEESLRWAFMAGYQAGNHA